MTLKTKMDSAQLEYSFEVDGVSKEEWSQLLLQFGDANIYQTWSYGEIRWGETNLSHLVLKREGAVVAAAQLRIIKIPLIKGGIAYLRWGPMCQVRGKEVDDDILRQMIIGLREEYVIGRRLLLRIVPNAIEGDTKGSMFRLIFEKEGFRRDDGTASYRTYLIDLDHSLTELRKGLDQKWRNQLNRAEKNSLEIVEGSDIGLYDKFMSLYKELMVRKNFETSVDINEFRTIQESLPEPIKMRIFICEHQGKALSALVGSAIGDTGIYLLGASSDDGMKAKGSYLLQWRMIQWLKEMGCRYYDLGGINPEKNPGVYHFKGGLGGKEVFHISQWEAYESMRNCVFMKLGEKMRNLQRNIKRLRRK